MSIKLVSRLLEGCSVMASDISHQEFAPGVPPTRLSMPGVNDGKGMVQE